MCAGGACQWRVFVLLIVRVIVAADKKASVDDDLGPRELLLRLGDLCLCLVDLRGDGDELGLGVVELTLLVLDLCGDLGDLLLELRNALGGLGDRGALLGDAVENVLTLRLLGRDLLIEIADGLLELADALLIPGQLVLGGVTILGQVGDFLIDRGDLGLELLDLFLGGVDPVVLLRDADIDLVALLGQLVQPGRDFGLALLELVKLLRGLVELPGREFLSSSIFLVITVVSTIFTAMTLLASAMFLTFLAILAALRALSSCSVPEIERFRCAILAVLMATPAPPAAAVTPPAVIFSVLTATHGLQLALAAASSATSAATAPPATVTTPEAAAAALSLRSLAFWGAKLCSS